MLTIGAIGLTAIKVGLQIYVGCKIGVMMAEDTHKVVNVVKSMCEKKEKNRVSE